MALVGGYRVCHRQGVPSGPAQVCTCEVGSRPVPGGGAAGYYVPFGWWSSYGATGCSAPGALRHRQLVPLGPAQVGTCHVVSRPVPGGGSRLSLEKARTQRVAGGCPPPPLFFIARSFPLARFGVVGRSGAIVGLFRGPGTCPDLDSHFAGAGFGGESISWRECSTYEGFPLGGSCHRR